MNWTKNFAKPEGKTGNIIIESMNIGHTAISKWGLKHIEFKPDSVCLDIGCGGGINVKRMLELAPEGRADGVDISRECVRKSKLLNRNYMQRCDIKLGSADAIPFGDEVYDVVTAFETVYFWPDMPKAFAEVMRVLKHGGRFYVICESCDPNTVWKKLVEGMNVYSPQQLEEFFTAAGYVDIKIDCPGSSRCCVSGQKPISE